MLFKINGFVQSGLILIGSLIDDLFEENKSTAIYNRNW